jgi:hypothetical protein
MPFSLLAEFSPRVWLVERQLPRRQDTHPLYEREVGRSGEEPAEKPLGLIRAFAGGEEVNATGLFSVD